MVHRPPGVRGVLPRSLRATQKLKCGIRKTSFLAHVFRCSLRKMAVSSTCPGRQYRYRTFPCHISPLPTGRASIHTASHSLVIPLPRKSRKRFIYNDCQQKITYQCCVFLSVIFASRVNLQMMQSCNIEWLVSLSRAFVA